MKWMKGLLLGLISMAQLAHAQPTMPARNVSLNDTSPSDTTQTIVDTSSVSPKKQRLPINHRLWVGTDIARIPLNLYNLNQQSYDFQVTYNHTAKNYWVAETGFGRGKVDYSFLKYNSDAAYLKIGIDRSFLETKLANDFDIAFIGVRYAASFVRRGDAWYSVSSPFGGIAEDNIPGKNIFLHWGEITAGMRLEVWHRVHVGWIGRGKFLLNSGSVSELAPNFVAGYGKADNATSFDIGLYLTYAILQWKK